MEVVGVRVEMPTNQPIVLLKETGGERYLPIWIGPMEATAIAFAQQGMVPARPLTHDLMRDILQALKVELRQVNITALRDGIFFADLVFSNGTTVSARPVGLDRARTAHRDDDFRPGRNTRRGWRLDPGRAGGRGREVPRVPRQHHSGRLRVCDLSTARDSGATRRVRSLTRSLGGPNVRNVHPDWRWAWR